MIDSRGNSRKVTVEDKPYSNMCNYSKSCQIKCYPTHKKIKPNKIDISTYRKNSRITSKIVWKKLNIIFQHEFHIVLPAKKLLHLRKKIDNRPTI